MKINTHLRQTLLSFILCLTITACQYTVDSFDDGVDINPGDRECARSPILAAQGDGGLCTLRAAIMEANASQTRDTIHVPPGTYNLSLPSASSGGRLIVNRGVVIQGSGATSTIVNQSQQDRVFHITGGEVEINHFTIQGGNAQTGGGIRVDENANLSLNDAILTENEAFTGGGGILITEGGDATIRRTSITNNSATGAFGGGVWNQGGLWIYDSLIANNQSNRAGGIRNSGNLNLRNVTVSGNVATSPDAGVGGISQNRFAFLNNVTVTNNTGVGNNAASFRGGGIQTTEGETTVMKNSIVAENNGGIGPNDCVGSLTADSKYNLIGDTNGCTIPSFVFTFLLNVDPLLGPLANNGGPTLTHLPGSTSQVINAAYNFPPPAVDACESKDQRGVPRHQGGGSCDMGAVERTSNLAFVTGFFLVDAETNTDIRPLIFGDSLDFDDLPSALSVRAVTSGALGSVVFDFDGVNGVQTENLVPYSLGGDSDGDYDPVPFEPGEHTITATPFTLNNGNGAAGGSLSIKFTLRD